MDIANFIQISGITHEDNFEDLNITEKELLFLYI